MVVVVALLALGGVAWYVVGRDHGTSAATTSTSTVPAPVTLVTTSGPDGSYTIGFPGRPDAPESLPQMQSGQQMIAWSEQNAFDTSGGRGYLVISQGFGRTVTRADQLRGLDAMAAQFATDPGAASIETTFQGFPARRFSMTAGGQPSSGLVLVTDTHVYLIMSIGSNPDAERQAVEDSFRLNSL